MHKKVLFYQELNLFNKLYQNFINNVELFKNDKESTDKENKDTSFITKIFITMNQEKLKDLKNKFTELYDIHNFMFLNRWGVYECTVCKESFESESQFNFHEQQDTHQENIKRVNHMGTSLYSGFTFHNDEEFLLIVKQYKKFQPVIFLSLMEHNSNALVWRDTGAKIIYIGFETIKKSNNESINNGFNYHELKEKIEQYKDHIIKIGTFTAASNITGEKLNVDLISIIMHESGGMAFFDYATGAPYLKTDMNNLVEDNFEDSDTPVKYSLENISDVQKKLCFKDAIFFSPHKFLGGPNTSGVLIIKQNIVRTLLKPADTGGGVVLFVTQKSAEYIKSIESREEAGTPDIIAAARIGLVILNKYRLNSDLIKQRHIYINNRVFSRLMQIPNLYLVGRHTINKTKVPVYSFLIKFNKKFLHYNFVCSLLNDLFGIQSRGGCICASTYGIYALDITDDDLHFLETSVVSGKEIFRPGFTRINFHYTLTDAEIDYILDAVEFVCYYGWMFLGLYKYKIEGGSYTHIKKSYDSVWLNNYSITGDKHNKGFNKNLEKYSEKNFDEEERSFYLIQAFEVLMNLENLYKQVLGKASINHKILFSNHSNIRWFLLPDEVDDIKKYVNSKSEFFIKKVINEMVLTEKIDIENSIKSILKDKLFYESLDSKLDTCFGSEIKLLNKFNVGEYEESDEKLIEQESFKIIKRKNNHIEKNSDYDDKNIKTSIKENKRIDNGSFTLMTKYNLNENLNNEENIRKLLKGINDNYNKDVYNNNDKEQSDKIIYKEEDNFFNKDINEDNDNKDIKTTNSLLFPKIPKAITTLVGEALVDFKMINEGDRILIGLSGGKDSLSLIHILLYFKKCAPVKFDIGVVTVDPQSDDYKPEPLKAYMNELGLPYFFESDPILERAKQSMKNEKASFCSFCSRMKRGLIYSCARRENYNVIALGQHLDDLAESFMMSVFHNGLLRTMKANYIIDAGDLRVIRPLMLCREKLFKQFCDEAKLPVIQDNCPACFSAPKERLRIKMLLAQQENLFPSLFSSLKKAMIPLMKGEVENGEKKKDDLDI